MDRRSFLGKSGLAAGTAALMLPASGSAQSFLSGRANKQLLTLVSAWPRGSTMSRFAEDFAERVNAMDGISFGIDVRYARELMIPSQIFEAVSSGSVHMYMAHESLWANRDFSYNFFSSVPMGLTHSEFDVWLQNDGGRELWEALSLPYNVMPLEAGIVETPFGGWFRYPVKRPEEFQGMKANITGVGADVLSRFGVVTQSRSMPEIIREDMRSGALDAIVGGSFLTGYQENYHLNARHYCYPAIDSSGLAISFAINRQLWQLLEPIEREIIRNLCRAQILAIRTSFSAEGQAAFDALQARNQPAPHQFPNSLIDVLANISEQVLYKRSQANRLSQQIYQHYMAARMRYSRWSWQRDNGQITARARLLDDNRMGSLAKLNL